MTAGLGAIERRLSRLEGGIQPDISDRLVNAVLTELSDFDLDALQSLRVADFAQRRDCGFARVCFLVVKPRENFRQNGNAQPSGDARSRHADWP